jgi:ppGpp synthetase/RelA/SpoT-type nucleotidyltranferase
MLIQSRKHLKKIGDVLREEDLDSQEFLDAYDGLSAFRALHLPAMQRVNIRCRQVIKKHPLLDLDRVIIAQRGKRLESVIRKLQRFEGMQLDRMQDVGGVRVILDTLEEVNSFTTHFPGRSKIIELERKYDYIHTPKEDGYRGIHLILGLENHDKTLCSFDKLTVELQVRTKATGTKSGRPSLFLWVNVLPIKKGKKSYLPKNVKRLN